MLGRVKEVYLVKLDAVMGGGRGSLPHLCLYVHTGGGSIKTRPYPKSSLSVEWI